jgi:hypothetical protein
MTLLCSVDLMFYALIGFALYHFIGKDYCLSIEENFSLFEKGPWYIGYLTEDYFGVVFLWGIFVRGGYLQPDSQLFFGTFQVI